MIISIGKIAFIAAACVRDADIGRVSPCPPAAWSLRFASKMA